MGMLYLPSDKIVRPTSSMVSHAGSGQDGSERNFDHFVPIGGHIPAGLRLSGLSKVQAEGRCRMGQLWKKRRKAENPRVTALTSLASSSKGPSTVVKIISSKSRRRSAPS